MYLAYLTPVTLQSSLSKHFTRRNMVFDALIKFVIICQLGQRLAQNGRALKLEGVLGKHGMSLMHRIANKHILHTYVEGFPIFMKLHHGKGEVNLPNSNLPPPGPEVVQG